MYAGGPKLIFHNSFSIKICLSTPRLMLVVTTFNSIKGYNAIVYKLKERATKSMYQFSDNIDPTRPDDNVMV